MPQAQNQRYCLIFICVIVFALAGIIAFNYHIDRFKIYHPLASYIETQVTPNERVLKFRSFAKNLHQFNAIIFGNSRTPQYKTKILKELFNLDAFNFGVSAESYHGILRKLKWMQKNNCVLKTIFLPINGDELNYTIDYSLPPYTLRRMDPPQIVDFENYKTTFNRIFLLSVPATLANLRYHFEEKQKEIKLSYTTATGDVDYLWDEKFKINECPAPNQRIHKKDQVVNETIYLLKQIYQLAHKSDVSIVFIWNPIPIENQLRSKQILEILDKIKLEYPFIQRIPLADSRLRDSSFYSDSNHFKSNLARVVLLPENRVPVGTLIHELKTMQDNCQKESGYQPPILNSDSR